MAHYGRLNLDIPPPEYIADDREAREFLQLCLNKVELDRGDPIGFDTETHGLKIEGVGHGKNLDWMRDTVLFWSLAFHLDGVPHRYCLQQQHLHMFVPLLENPDASLVVWNLKYDAHVCWNSGIDIWNADAMDVLAMAYLVDENLQGDMSLKSRCAEGLVLRNFREEFPKVKPWKPFNMTKFNDLFGYKNKQTKKALKEFETSLLELPRELVVDYASLDAYAHLMMFEHARDLLQNISCGMNNRKKTMWDYYLEVEKDITKTLWRMERRGYAVDVDRLAKSIPDIEKEVLEIESAINKDAGWPVNLGSPKQLVELFFGPKPRGLGLTPIKMTKGGAKEPQPSTDEDVLEILSMKGVKMAKRIIRLRKLKKIQGTYIGALMRLAEHHLDGRIHSSFNQFGARTGRFSTSTPNSQNFPRPDGDEFGIRAAFIAEVAEAKVRGGDLAALSVIAEHIADKIEADRTGRKLLRKAAQKTAREIKKKRLRLIVGDYEQLEMRIMAHFCKDPAMLAAIKAGKDMHCETVSRMFPGVTYEEAIAAKKYKGKYDDAKQKAQKDGVPCELEAPTARQLQLVRWRQEAKTIGFALIYGAGAGNIAGQLDITKEEAQQKIDAYFRAFPGVKRFMDNIQEFCWENGYVETILGRRRRLPAIRSSDRMVAAHAMRESINAPVQGTAADLVKCAMLRIENDKRLNDAGVVIINQIHDELVLEAPEDVCEWAVEIIREHMEHPFEPGRDPLDVPAPVSLKIVDRWADAK